LKRLLTTLLIFALAYSVAGQVTAGEITGRVLNKETDHPVKGVTVRVLETGKAVATDKQGYFEIKNVGDGEYHLLATHIAFDRSDTIRVAVTGTSSPIDIELNPAPWVLNDVVVTGTRSPHLLKDVPVETQVVTRRDFQRTGATSVDQALTSSIGLTINEDLSGQGATIRGIEGDRVLVMVDGERAVGRVRGSIDLSQYSLNNVEKIEIVKGTGSTLYGSDAMGGVVNIITNVPKQNATNADLYCEYGSHNSLNPSATFGYGNKDFGFTLGGKLFSTDGFDLDKSTPHTNGQEKTDRYNFDAKVRKTLSPHWFLSGSGRYMDESKAWLESEIIQLSPTRDTTYVYDSDEKNKRYDGSATLKYVSGEKYSMNLRFYGTYYDHLWKKYSGPFWIDTAKTEDSYYEASYSSNYVIGDSHVATYGFDFSYQDLTSTELIDETRPDKSYAGYLQYEWSPIEQLTFLPGARYEHHSSFGNHFNPSINVMYHPSEDLKFRGFVGRGFRAPSIKQQYFIFDHTSAGYIVYGGRVPLPDGLATDGANFTDLKEENSINSSISAEFSYGAIGMHRITFFYNHLDDLIDFTLIGFTPTYWRGVYIYQNIETAITKGIEWESRVRLSKSVDLSLSYNYLSSKNLATGEELINRPAHTVKLYLSGFWEKTGMGATIWGDYQSKKLWVPRSNTGGNEGEPEYAPSRSRLNLNVFKRFGAAETFVRFENILNDTNVTYGYWPGFTVMAGFKYDLSFKNQ
jgi:outer membrane receptor for ferrienterochelin and colicins